MGVLNFRTLQYPLRIFLVIIAKTHACLGPATSFAAAAVVIDLSKLGCSKPLCAPVPYMSPLNNCHGAVLVEVVGKIAVIAAIRLGDGIIQCRLRVVSDVVAIDTILHNSAIGIPFNASAVVFQDADIRPAVELL